MALKITYFNVGHGDSILIEELNAGITTGVIVVDSNLIKVESVNVSPVYNYLVSKGIKSINAVIISHFDQDHYTGIELLLNNFEIKSLIIPPIFSLNTPRFNDKLRKFKELILEKAKLSSDSDFRSSMKGIASLLAFIKENVHLVEEKHGSEQVLRIPDMPNIHGKVYLPVAGIKGLINQKIESNNFDLEIFSNMNETSIAFEIIYDGVTILFAGDSERSQWIEHKRLMSKHEVKLNTDILKAPHHGSKYNNDEVVYNYIYGNQPESKFVIISANGKSHPHNEFYQLADYMKLKPICTNMSTYCFENVTPFSRPAILPEIAKFFISSYSNLNNIVPCQGNITLDIDAGAFHFTSSNHVPCIF